jgi:Domain of unknown function (DUF4293)
MWQRIQSVFLGITILSLIAGLFFPVWLGGGGGIEYRLYPIYFLTKQVGPNGQLMVNQYFPFCLTAMLMVAAATIAIMEFRRFDNRILQIKLGTLNSLILAGVLICDVLFSNNLVKSYPVPWKYDYSLWLTFVAVVGNWLAVRFIRRDEKLVRDSDRIR